MGRRRKSGRAFFSREGPSLIHSLSLSQYTVDGKGHGRSHEEVDGIRHMGHPSLPSLPFGEFIQSCSPNRRKVGANWQIEWEQDGRFLA